MSTNTGGPAFPINANESADRCIYTGMTLRDWFAGQAMQGLCAREDGKGFDFLTFPDDPMRVAHWAYDVADEMIKARNT
jgi:hypothetical protein